MIKTGLVSISFRKLEAFEIIDMTAKAGLDAIEWGGDIHVPHGDRKTAEYVHEKCMEKQILCPSYGSYYKVGEYITPVAEFMKALDCASILESKIIRVWAGVKGSAEADPEYRDIITEELGLLCDLAGKREIGIGLEYHAGTLTDDAGSAKTLIESAGRKNLSTYWQPPVGRSLVDNLYDIWLLGEYISNIHVFTWRGRERLELAAGIGDWIEYAGVLDGYKSRFMMLEFIKDDSIEGFYRDADTLREIPGKIKHKDERRING
ncbi:MAG: TIM barrel protein [Clostridia bacterium]|nr:TIM barrel protein [Clostridia bacterium]